ncbi:hypothetical protein MUB24_12830 [Lederbergia sp. NSJ-179]|uniref:hypothetical protein n=1 Tax=Lederbergia sp. NSJ-179 TaxID=2931402 RepID=UPI001FD1F216|nr:hypothetical protein [Lederbergia sp. NSJ-179]MCJ7841767.1 hypothetical protein [Lederbergia sp. NSJ-179]
MKEIENLNSSHLFFCYTKSLSLFLKDKGIPYILKAKSIKDDNIFTLYAKGEKLQQALDEFNSKNKSLIKE